MVKPLIFFCLTGLLALTAVMSPAADVAPTNSPVLLIGDSMMRLPGMAMERELSKLPGIKAHTFSGIGTGLSRLDVFDWLEKIRELCAEHKPKVAVISLGANDRQPMQLAEGRGVVQPDTQEWEAEYSDRIGQAMDIFITSGCDRVVWLLLPPMRDAVVDRHAKKLNALIEAESARRKQVILYDAGPMVSDRRTGGFTERIIDPKTSGSIMVRDRDGIHLTPQGARMLATALIDKYWKDGK